MVKRAMTFMRAIEVVGSESDQTDSLRESAFRFRHYCLYPRARLLLRNDEPIELGARAFDLLALLLRERGCVVGKDKISEAVWPSTTVEECNIRFQMTTLRKALGADRDLIKTIPGRGYLFLQEPFCRHIERNFGVDLSLPHSAINIKNKVCPSDPVLVVIEHHKDKFRELEKFLRSAGLKIYAVESAQAFGNESD